MARIDSLANFLEDVATKIRSKTGSQSTITPANYDTEIQKIVFKPTNEKLSFAGNISSGDRTVVNFDLRNLDVSEIKDFTSIFRNLRAMKSIDLSNFYITNATTLSNMFRDCRSLTSLDLSTFDTRNLSNMVQMFYGCSVLETITFGNNFTFESMTTGSTTVGMYNMFDNCTKLDNDTLNAILHICTTTTENYTGTKTLDYLGIKDTFDNYANIPNLSNYQDFLDAGWTIS